MSLKSIKEHSPEFLKRAYHRVRAFAAARKYGFPAREMIVVGITGTKGKTSTANYVWSVLTAGGYTAGLISSANFRIGTVELPNPYHMTMPDPYIIQKKLREMRDAGVTIVAMEMTSEGMKQYRHFGIPVDFAVFTNLTPEHLGSHGGSFELYKKAKIPLFRDALRHAPKTIDGKHIPRVSIANSDSEHAETYLAYPADIKRTFGIQSGDVCAASLHTDATGTSFMLNDEKIQLAIPGAFNVYNALPAVIIGRILGIAEEKIREGLSALKVIPGRMELINEGQDFVVVVDYAHEPASLGALLDAAALLKHTDGKIILLIGIIGGGREPRTPLARLAAERADTLIITNEDPYDADPEILIEELAQAAEGQGKKRGNDLFPILDRREGIQKALALAQRGDIVLISGKGAEQTMITKAGAIPWNERAIVRGLVKERI